MIRRFRPVLGLVLAMALVLGGCTRMQEVPLAPTPLQEAVKPGEKVRVTLRDGTVRELEVTAVEPEAIVAGEERVAAAEIVKLERREVDVGKTAAATVGGLALVGLVILGIALVAVAPAMFLGGG